MSGECSIAPLPSIDCNSEGLQRCNKRIYHENWSSDVKFLEARWSHNEARKREIGEVRKLAVLCVPRPRRPLRVMRLR